MNKLDADSDDELMARIIEQDREAFAVLLDRHLANIRAFLWYMTHNEADADDLSQETFLRVWKNAHTWQPGRVRFTTWLHRIARNACIDALRKKRDAEDIDVDSLAAQVAADGEADGAAHALSVQRMTEALARALDALPERQRMAVVLCHHQGFSNREAADALEVTMDALESLLSRGRRALRKALRGYREELDR